MSWGKREQIQLISSGGQLERKYGCYVNPSLVSQLKPLDIDLFYFFLRKGSTATAGFGIPIPSTPTLSLCC
ncbi:DNA-binding transcriptional activator FucR [Kluyvera cryocrescens]|uniref:DNA-binding transcriptional activator FucR n=1 Tax=Kluyvera cryocrescens TaxID=580 RepID=A0A485B3S3_KLUCR|nr:DNA-binding transcriptional activator FucR [Kluyvera cryocrescens]